MNFKIRSIEDNYIIEIISMNIDNENNILVVEDNELGILSISELTKKNNMKKYNLKTVLSLFIVMLFAQINYAQTVTIGTQVWTSKNLNVSTYRNGDVIPQVQDPSAWANLTTGAWCYYNNDTSNGTKYGKLYNWSAVNDPRGLTPNGYHIPTNKEWTKLTDYLGGESGAGTKMKSTSGWYKGNGTNSSGFSGLPGGVRSAEGAFNGIDIYGAWWSSADNITHKAWGRILGFDFGNVYRNDYYKGTGFSVRCLRD